MALKTDLRKCLQEAKAGVQALQAEYKGEEPGENVVARLQAILGAQSLDEGQARAKRALDVALVHYLSLWARGKIPGKTSVYGLDVQIRRCESLIDLLVDKGLADQAESQRLRLASLKEEQRLLRREEPQ